MAAKEPIVEPGQRAYEAYYSAIGGWATDRHWAMISPDERRAWEAVGLAAERAWDEGAKAAADWCNQEDAPWPVNPYRKGDE